MYINVYKCAEIISFPTYIFFLQLINYGAAIRSILLKDSNGKITDVCLGFDNIDGYLGYDNI